MSVESVIARVNELHTAFVPRGAATAEQTGTTQFGTALNQATGALNQAALGALGPMGAMGGAAVAGAPGAAAGGSPGARALAAAQAEVGQAEQPPGSNDSPRIAQYREATAGSGVGPWCAYFTSWAAKEAGVPLGEQGQGFGAVAAVDDWAKRTGRSVPAGSTPQPGDLIVWGGRHIGIVESVGATARSTRSRATPRTRSRGAPTGATAAGPPATSGWVDRPDPAGALVVGAQQRDRRVGVLVGHDADEAAAHVEDVPHLLVGDLAEPLHEAEHRRDRQRVLDAVVDVVAQPVEVLQAAAGDVGEAVDVDGVAAQELEHRLDVDDRRLEQDVGDRPALELGRGGVQAERLERGARERVAVGVQARGGDADQRVAGRDGVPGHDRVELRRCR
jgi:hypothetical protein